MTAERYRAIGLDHVSLPVRDLARAAAFYDRVLAPLELGCRKERPGAVGFGPASLPAPVLWLLERRSRGSAESGLGLHVSFRADTRAQVEAFHAAALAAGGRDAGAPGERPEYTAPFYGAFAFDLDGFKIEAVCRTEP